MYCSKNVYWNWGLILGLFSLIDSYFQIVSVFRYSCNTDWNATSGMWTIIQCTLQYKAVYRVPYFCNKKYKRISDRYALLYWHQKLLIRLCFQKSYCILLITRSINVSSYVCSGVFENYVRLHRTIQEEKPVFWELIVSAIVRKKFISTRV